MANKSWPLGEGLSVELGPAEVAGGGAAAVGDTAPEGGAVEA